MIKNFLKEDYFKVEIPQSLISGFVTDIPYKVCIRDELHEQDFDFDLFMSKTDRVTPKNSFLVTFCNLLCLTDLIPSVKSTH